MERKVVLFFSWMVMLVLAMGLQPSFAADKAINFTSVQEGGTISIYPNSFPVEKVIKGKVTGFSKEELLNSGLTVDLFFSDVLQGSGPVSKKGKWEVKVTLTTADLAIKAIVKDKAGNELATALLNATASGEF